jgi:hypothetical protein
MKRSVLTAGAAALIATLSAAHADEIVGRISGLDDTAHRITLTNGHTYTLATLPGASYFAGFNDNLRVGEKVRLVEDGGVVTGIYAE